jgi:hypothetical protein
MSRTSFSGPVASANGFEGNVTGNVTGNVSGAAAGGASGAIAATTLSASGVTSLANASISMPALPTADPTVAGRLWNDGGTVKVSAG